jgi:hypothetical protein
MSGGVNIFQSRSWSILSGAGARQAGKTRLGLGGGFRSPDGGGRLGDHFVSSAVRLSGRVRGGGGVVRAPGRRPFHQFCSQRSDLPAAIVCEAVQGPRRTRQQPGCSSVRACFHGRRDQSQNQGVVSILHSARSVVAATRRGET